jgi:arylsulfatase
MALRMHDWKIVFEEQRATGFEVWREPLVKTRLPVIYNLRTDPFERGQEGMFYQKWMADRAFLLIPAQMAVGQWLQSFKEFPPRAKAASFSLDRVVESFMPKS